MNELIQCEFCDIYIDFNDYLYHVRECSENMEQNASEFTSYSSLFSSITSALEHSFNQFQQINEDTEYTEDDGDEQDVEENVEDDEEENSNTIEINDNYITARININLNLQRIANDNYHRYSNLEDVNKPVKDIDLVAPLISNELIPYDSNCAICQELISNPARKTLCNHFFCSNCLEPWLKELNKTCPSCLTNLDDMYEKNQNENENENETETEND